MSRRGGGACLGWEGEERNWTHLGTGVVLKGSQGDSVAAVEVPVQVGSAAQVNLLIVARLAVGGGVEAEQSAKARKGGGGTSGKGWN